MQLVSVLASGVAGAENGVAIITRRGDTSLATLYSDYQGTVLYQPSEGLALDGHGGTVCYVNEEADVSVRDTLGNVVRAFTVMEAAPNVEVRSLSFTGHDYTSGAAAAGNPTDLQTVLDAWLMSAGATDFNVSLPGGGIVSIASALAGTAGIFVNVKDRRYGAVGDGVKDDSAAIQLALTETALNGGGIVAFPPGSYIITVPLSLPANVSLWGVSRQASLILLNSGGATNAIEMTATASSGYQEIRNLTVASLVASSGSVLVYVNGGARSVAIVNSSIGSAANNSTAPTIKMDVTGQQRLLVDASTIAGAQTQGAIINAQSFTVRVEMRNALISGLAGTTVGLAFLVAAYNLKAVSTTFNIVSTSGLSNGIGFSSSGASGPNISVIGCDFLTGSAGWALFCISTFDAAATLIVEQGNTYSTTFTAPVFGITSGGLLKPKIQLGFRTYAQHDYSDNSATLALESPIYGIVTVARTTNADQTLTAQTMPAGSKLSLEYVNGSGGNIANLFFGTGFASNTPTITTLTTLKQGRINFTSMDLGGGSGCKWFPDSAMLVF